MASAPVPGPDPRSAVDETVRLLGSFNHRNKNQHRTTKWWARFNGFRRAVQKLAAALEAADDALVRQRAAWLREHVLPPSYIAFTHLAAHNTFAPLGLFLIGVLARVNSVTAPLVPAPSPVGDVALRREAALLGRDRAPATLRADDVGVVIARESISAPRPLESPREVAGRARDHQSHEEPPKPKKKRRRKGGDEFTDLFSSLS